MNKKLFVVALVSMLAIVSLASCSGPGGAAPAPTITAIPLPSETSRVGARPGAGGEGAAATATPSPQPGGSGSGASSPASAAPPTVPPTATPFQLPTATPIQLPATPTPLPPTATSLPTVTPLPTATPSPTAIRVAAKPTPRPRPTPRYTGKLVFQTALGGELYIVNVDGSGLRRLTDGFDPIWSPDGKQVAFTRWRDPRGVWLINADGSGARILFPWSETRWPSWSPDGSRILFTRQHGGRTGETERCFHNFCFTLPPNPHWQLGIVNVSDGSFDEPASPLVSLAPDWSPGGGHIVFTDKQGLKIENIDGTNAYQLTSDTHDTDPVWSPDGQRVAFTFRQHDHWEVYAIDASGQHLARLTDTPALPDGTPADSAAAAWSPDGKYIAFYTNRSGQWEIWVMKADGSQEQPMFPGGLGNLKLDYAYDGDRALSWTR